MSLMSIRWKSLGWTLLGYAITGVLGFLLSDTFRDLVVQYTGSTVVFSVFALIVPEILKHLRNKGVVKAARSKGYAAATSNIDLI